MPKPVQPPVTQETTYACEITVPNKHLPAIKAGVEGEASLPEKIAALAEGTLLDLCEGGMMLNAQAIKRMAESLGRMPTVEEIITEFSRGVGRVAGKLQIVVDLPPEMEGVVQAAAEFQGVSMKQVLQDAWSTAWDNGDFYDYRPYVQRVLMRNDDKEKLVKLLGKDFVSGTELAELVEKYVAENDPLAEVK